MKTRKLLSRIMGYLDDDARSRHIARKELKRLLKKLKEKEKELDHKLAHCEQPEKRAALKRKIALLRAHRKKGIAQLRRENGTSPPTATG